MEQTRQASQGRFATIDGLENSVDFGGVLNGGKVVDTCGGGAEQKQARAAANQMKGLSGSKMKTGQGLYRCAGSGGRSQSRKQTTEQAEQEQDGSNDDGQGDKDAGKIPAQSAVGGITVGCSANELTLDVRIGWGGW